MKSELVRIAQRGRVQALAGTQSKILSERCPLHRITWPKKPCDASTCHWWINGGAYHNCCFLAAEIGEHTLAEIGDMMGVSRERIRQIEELALRKLKGRFKRNALYKQSLAIRNSSHSSTHPKSVREDEADIIRSLCNGDLEWIKWGEKKSSQ